MSSKVHKRMHGPALVSNSAATKYTVPSNRRAVVRHIHVQNPSGSPVTFTLSIGSDAAGSRIFDAFSIPAAASGVAASVLDHYCYYVLEAGEVIQAFAGTNNVLTLTIDGDEIVLA
jgi:hypothetical protein